jgi:hypothetical protein
MALLTGSFGLPSLFYGGVPLPKREPLLPLFTSLPHYLVFMIVRKNPHSQKHNTTTLSFSIDMDMGKFLEEGAQKPAVVHGYASPFNDLISFLSNFFILLDILDLQHFTNFMAL